MKKKIIIGIIIGILLGVLIWFGAFFYNKYNRDEIIRYDDGQVESISLKRGEGTFLHYYGDGSINFESYIGNRLRDVHGTGYYESGNIASIFDINNRSGEVSYYYSNGQLMRKESYKNGKPDGERLYYYENGQLESKQNYENGKRHGEWSYYYEDGQLEHQFDYEKGKIVHSIVCDENGVCE